MPILHKRPRPGPRGSTVARALGLAAFVGVAATGVAIARAERQRRAYTPDEVRARLHARHQESGQDPA
jgi:hypothetical protein